MKNVYIYIEKPDTLQKVRQFAFRSIDKSQTLNVARFFMKFL